jgi:hypothetical protein
MQFTAHSIKIAKCHEKNSLIIKKQIMKILSLSLLTILFILLPFIVRLFLLYIPGRGPKKEDKACPVENEEIFDHLFISKDKRSVRFRKLTGREELNYQQSLKTFNNNH